MNKDKYLKILGLSGNPNEKQIKKTYRKLAVEYHPDNHINEGLEKQKYYEEKMKEINEAYEYLTKNTFDNFSEYSQTSDFSFVRDEKINFGGKINDGSYYSYFHKKTIIDEDFDEEKEFIKRAFQDERFYLYHYTIPLHKPKDHVNYKKYNGENSQVLYYGKQSTAYKSVLIFKLFTLWHTNETNNSLKCKLNKFQLFGEKQFLDRFFDSHPPLYFYPYFRKYVQIYLSAIAHFETMYSEEDLTLYKEISKYRRKIMNKMINEYREEALQNGQCFEYEKVKKIIDNGIETVHIYCDHDLMPSEISSEIIDKLSEDWIGSYNHLAEDYEKWRDKIALFTNFWLQIEMFYSNVIFAVFKFYRERFSNCFEIKNKLALDKLLSDMHDGNKISLTIQELKVLIDEPNFWNEQQEENMVKDNQDLSNSNRVKKLKWWSFK